MKIGIGLDQTGQPGQPSSGWNLAYAWATTLAPSIQTTQRQDLSVSPVITSTQASALAPTVSTSSSVSTSVSPIVASSSASSGVPTVSTTKSPNIVAVIANAQATAGTPSVSTDSTVNVSVSSIVAGATASAGVPTVSIGGGSSTLASDSFNRANGALGTADSGQVWQTNTANFIVSSNKGSVNALDDTQFAYIDVGQSNVSVSLDFSQTSTLGNCPKLFFRGIDYKNAYVIYWVSSGWQLYKLVNGVPTSLSSSTIVGGPTSTNTVTAKAICNGNSLSWYLNGTLVATITDNTYTGTKYGWGSQRVNGLADNFLVTTP